MNRVFIGYDERQPLAYSVCQHSVIANSTQPVAVTPLVANQLPIKRFGLTAFTYSRFLVPWLCQFDGDAIFMDPDIVVIGDIDELFEYCRGRNEAVVINPQQPKFEWPSVIYFNAEKCPVLSPDYVNDDSHDLFDLESWAGTVGAFPAEWNHCEGYAAESVITPKLIHYTEGIPCWPETKQTPLVSHWHKAREWATFSCDWVDLMGRSIHAKQTLRRFINSRVPS